MGDLRSLKDVEEDLITHDRVSKKFCISIELTLGLAKTRLTPIRQPFRRH